MKPADTIASFSFPGSAAGAAALKYIYIYIVITIHTAINPIALVFSTSPFYGMLHPNQRNHGLLEVFDIGGTELPAGETQEEFPPAKCWY